MNSICKIMTKLGIVGVGCATLRQSGLLTEVESTIMWMEEECNQILVELSVMNPDVAHNYAERGDKCISAIREKMYLKKSEEIIGEELNLREATPEDFLYIASANVRMLEDSLVAKNKRYLIEPLVDAAYVIENALPVDKDETREEAFEFVDLVYRVMEDH